MVKLLPLRSRWEVPKLRRSSRILFLVSALAVGLPVLCGAQGSSWASGIGTERPKMADAQIRKNFRLSEFGHKGNEYPEMDSQFLDTLQLLRDLVGKPVVITSGSRTPEYNKQIGGVPDSQHLENRAADLKVDGMTPKEIADYAVKAGFTGIGVYDKHLHVDTREVPSYWEGKSK